MTESDNLKTEECCVHHRAIRDTMDVLSGKWKISIIGSLSFGKKRFMELIDSIEGIAAKMLSKELQELELQGLVTRTVLKTKPITVEYELTDYGRSLKPIIHEMAAWGMQHRERIISEMSSSGQEAKG
ncbi:winged helix-turn-helix transcriptional regulator [Pedobacter mucosus]|uniref:winged helix-turn-helix transcriptional regulator n=1 Tax=Pedobacter mucosus TaxID=2895286 RepID=UPI001EE4DC82|nr:helix-turn-helix domain-containing protein [Pedobacter mucosus]UKT65041.1 helix-turn-helix transcriptional regulator [Pedobacter mucosus]